MKAVVLSYQESDSFFISSSYKYPESGIQHQERLETLSHSPDISSVMQIKFVNKYFTRVNRVSFLLSVLFCSINLFGQTQTNLDVFYSLTDSLVDQINSEIPSTEKKIFLTLNLGQSYSLFSSSIKERFRQRGKEILEQPTDELNIPKVDIVLEGAGVEYGEMYRDGWFGSHNIQRYSTIFGNYVQTFSKSGKRDFEITRLDTVKVDDIKLLENESFPFTKGTTPAEPFLSGFAEPLIAIGTVAAVIVLFFTVRSE